MNTKMKTRLISLMICIVMLVGLMPTTALAADTYWIDIAGGTVTDGLGDANGPNYIPGTSVTITAAAPSTGKQFAGWDIYVHDDAAGELEFTAGDETTSTATFKMPASTMYIESKYIDIEYNVNVVNGTIKGSSATSGKYKMNDLVNIEADEHSLAYMGFYEWLSNGITDKDTAFTHDGANTRYFTPATFTMPAKDVTVTASYGVSDITATTTGLKPVLGNDARVELEFTFIPGLSDMVEVDGNWQYAADGSDWANVSKYNNYAFNKFIPGYWRYSINVKYKPAYDGMKFCRNAIVTVNGEEWERVASKATQASAYSPTYYLDSEGNVSVDLIEITEVAATHDDHKVPVVDRFPTSLTAGEYLPTIIDFEEHQSEVVLQGNGKWQKKNGSAWEDASGKVAAGATYRFKTTLKMHSDNSSHTLADNVKLTVDGVSWTVDTATMENKGTKDAGVTVYSPEITVPAATTINTINIKGITAPVAGEAPVITGITTDTAGITLTNIQWQNGSSVLNSTNKFVAGQTYNLWIRYAVSEGYEVSDDVTVTSDLENSTNDIVTATRIVHVWYTVPAAPKYTVTVTGGGKVDGKDSVTTEAGTRLQLRAPEVSGKRFTGWSGLDGVTFYGDNAKVTDPILGFIMPAKNFTVTANYQDAVEITTINIKGITTPIVGANPVNFGVTTDTTGLSVKEVIWYFDRTPSTNVPHDYEFQLGDKLYLLVFLDVADGYTFADPVTITADLEYTAAYRSILSYGTVYLEYTVTEKMPATYTVSFDANSGTGTMTPVTGVSGEYELPACTFTAPSGKQFKAWSVGGAEKKVGDKITVTADTTVTAVWEAVSEYTKKGDVSAVTATATIDPALGATTSSVSFTITDPTDAAAKGVKISGSSWYKKDASSIYGWTQCSNGVDTFKEGTYRLEVQLRSESNDAKEYYAMSGETTFTVNGVQWSGKEQFRDYYASGGYGYRFFVSPEFTLGGKTLDSIAITTPPTKTVYREGEDFDPAGMVVTATYTDSPTASVVLYTVTDGTAMAAGKTTVTISYTEGGVTKTTTQTITVAKEYTVTVNGGTGNGKYVAGEEVTISAFVSGGQMFKEWQGTDGLTFTSGDKNSQTATFTMPAHDVTLTAVTGPAEYYVSVSGGSGTGMYEAGATVTIVADSPMTGRRFKEWVVGDGKVLRFAEGDITSSTAKFVMPGEAVRIYATYEDIPAPAPVTLDSIEVTTPPTKTEYTAGETFDPAGMVVTATYSDSSTAPVTGYTVTPAGALGEGDTEITVTYTEDGVIKTATLDITVSAQKYRVSTASSQGAKLTVTPSAASEGERVSVTATPKSGYVVTAVKVYDSMGNFICDVVGGSFTMPATDVTVRVEFKKKRPTAVEVRFDASVVLNGAELEAGMFSFELSKNGRVIEILENPADGKMTFAPIAYIGGGTYVYTIRQIKGTVDNIEYDETVYTITVKVTGANNSRLVAEVIRDEIVFTNTYIAPEETTEEPEVTTAPEETTEEPEVTTAPEETTEEPEVTTAPEETAEEPEVTTAPEETTEEPEVTTAPEETTEEPEVTTAPEETTEEPEVTTAPEETTEEPEVTTAPGETTEEPEVTTAPEETTEEPEVTTAPEETTEEPEVTTAPEETTEEPEVTTAPEETTEEPEVTTAPEETTEEPEVTTAPEETTEEPEVTTEPENPKTSDNSIFIIVALIATTIFGTAFLAGRKRED